MNSKQQMRRIACIVAPVAAALFAIWVSLTPLNIMITYWPVTPGVLATTIFLEWLPVVVMGTGLASLGYYFSRRSRPRLAWALIALSPVAAVGTLILAFKLT